MPIYAQGGLFQLDTQNSSYQFAVDEHGALLHTWYGARIPVESRLPMLCRQDVGFSGSPGDVLSDRSYSFDTLPQELPCAGAGDYRDPMLQITYQNGGTAADFRYQSHEILPAAQGLPGLPALYGTDTEPGETLIVTLKEVASELTAKLIYGVFAEQDIITRSVVLENHGREAVMLDRVLSMALDFGTADFTLTAFCGRHAMERQPESCPVGPIKAEFGSVRGASSHQYNPAFLLSRPGAAETAGECYGFCFVYSGNFIASAQADQLGHTRMLMGIHPRQFRWELGAGQSFAAPQVMLSYSGSGLGALSGHFHDSIREHLCRGPYRHGVRPLLINNWEATYFAFDKPKLLALARQAAELGIEMLVLDDGWFGKRDSDTSGLGDWYPNEKKLGGTLAQLGCDIRALGLRFGLWVEPEMLSEDSDLYRAHPDWAVAIPGRQPNRARSQLVLDMTRAEVRDYLFARLSAVLRESQADYLKWDMNRSVCDAFSHTLPPHRMGEFYHRFTLGTYELLERLLTAFPQLMIEGCCGGGGRFDAGMLYYTPQIWCSDNTDAIDRVAIQYGTSFFYPPCTMGAHVSACPNAQTGRTVPMATRAAVALAGSFGYELDPAQLSQAEKQTVQEQNAAYHRYYELVHEGDYFRLTDLAGDTAAWAFAAKDKSRVLVTAVQLERRGYGKLPRIPLRGFAPAARYRCRALDMVCSGAAWMAEGVVLKSALRQHEAVQLLFERIDGDQ